MRSSLRIHGLDRWLLGLVGLALVVSCPFSVSAVDTPSGPPDYLKLTIRPQWRLVDLDEALQQLGEEIEKPVSLSQQIRDENPTLVLLEDQKSTVREVLELLERTHDLHFVAEPLRLVVSTGSEHRRQQRSLVNLNLRDYGLFFNPKSNAPTIVMHSNDESGEFGPSPFGFSADDEDEEFPFELLGFLDTIESLTGGGDVEVRGTGNLMLLLTPREEERLRALCDQLYRMIVRRSSWRVHFGTVPDGSGAIGGVVPAADVRTLVESLQNRVELSATAMNGQNVTAWRGVHESDVQDAEVNQTGVFPVVNPSVLGSAGGRTVRLQPHLGLRRTLLSFAATWTEVDPKAQSTQVQSPSSVVAGHGSIKGSVTDQTASVIGSPDQIDPGRTLTLTQRAVWRWQPSGEVFVTADHGLVILGVRGDQRLAIVFEEVK